MATTTPDRIFSLDLVRGVAVMGIVTMNVYAFALPVGAYFNPTVMGGASGLDLATWFVDFALFDGKMRGLFAMLFGASTLLVIERAMASKKSAAFTHYSRMFWLFLFGMAHYWLLWWGDVLAYYALAGCFLFFFFRKMGPKGLRNWGIGLLGAMILLGMSQMGAMISILNDPSKIPAEQAAQVQEQLAGMKMFLGADTSGMAAEIARIKGDYTGLVDWRFNEQRWKMLFFSAQGLPMTIAIMLIGMWLFRNGFLTASWEKVRYRKVAMTCLGIGTLGSALIAGVLISKDWAFDALLLASLANAPFQVISAVGWAALIIMLIKKGHLGELASRIAAAGRMAFTNYLGTSVVMTLIFYGYGLNQFGEYGRFTLNAFVILMAVLMLLWSKPWLERYRYGPLEWLWRSLARLSLQPMRK